MIRTTPTATSRSRNIFKRSQLTMKRNPILATLFTSLLIAAAAVAWAHEKVKLTGYVVDVACAGDFKDSPEKAAKSAAEHTKECALMEDCVKSGYGILADGKWYPFDAKGSELAKALFEKTSKKDH